MARKVGSVFDANMVRKSIENTNQAYARGCKKKNFSLSVPGTFYGTKFGDLVKGSIKAIKQTIIAIRDTGKRLHCVDLKFFIHDSSTVFNFGEASGQYETIIAAIREFVGPEVSVNHSLIHKKSDEPKMCIEGTIIEKELWK